MRRWLTRPGLVVLLLAVVVAAVTSGSRAATRHEATYTYGTQVRQGIDAYWYDADQARPALLILHGGYFNSGSKTDWAATARYFADHGFAVFAADYRWGTDAEWPAPRDDALAATDWIKAHAAEFDADAAHVAVLGSQAGGQLATTLATYGAGRTRIDAAVGLSPINSPYRAWTQAPTSTATATRRTIRDETVVLHRCYPDKTDTDCWARWTDSVAKAHASGPDDAPMYLIHSTGDTIPPIQSTDLRDAELAKGADPADITVQTASGSASGGPLLTTILRAKVLTWLKARAQGILPPRTTPGDQTTPAPRSAPQLTATAGDATTPAGPRTTSGTTTNPPVQNDDPVPTPPKTESLHALTDTDVTLTTGTYAYGTDPKQQLDAYYTPTTTKQPALVIIHGGYWYEDDKSSWTATAQWYAERGYAVFSINYRLNTQSGWTAQRTDAINAIAWIKSHATQFTIDPKRVLILGSSAGGQIATAVGTYGTGTTYVRGIVALSPVASPYRAYNDGQAAGASASKQKLRDNSTLLARCHPTSSDTTCWKRWTDAVVKNHASSGDAPMYLLHSEGDFVPSTHSADLCTALKAKTVSCTLQVVPGSGHASAILKISGIHTKILTWLQAHD
ncbi:MAG TPA: alpha/beta fold hydrolase [Actinoallomurus sp.]|nr:alpha/beta fold hydrolase [Actinoallomurus sp.]